MDIKVSSLALLHPWLTSSSRWGPAAPLCTKWGTVLSSFHSQSLSKLHALRYPQLYLCFSLLFKEKRECFTLNSDIFTISPVLNSRKKEFFFEVTDNCEKFGWLLHKLWHVGLFFLPSFPFNSWNWISVLVPGISLSQGTCEKEVWGCHSVQSCTEPELFFLHSFQRNVFLTVGA